MASRAVCRREIAARRYDSSVRFDVLSEFHFDNTLDGVPIICRQNLICKVWRGVVQHSVGASLFTSRHTRPSGRRNHPCTAPFCELHRQVANGARATMREHGLADDLAAAKNGVDRRQSWDAQDRPCFKADLVGEWDRLLCW